MNEKSLNFIDTVYYHLGTFYLSEKRYNLAFKYYIKSHIRKKGYCTAALAFMLEFGLGIERDVCHSEKLYLGASKAGILLSFTRLTFLKTHGRPGILINIKDAFHYRKKISSAPSDRALSFLFYLANKGLAEAEFSLALCYYNSTGTVSDANIAFHYCKQVFKFLNRRQKKV